MKEREERNEREKDRQFQVHLKELELQNRANQFELELSLKVINIPTTTPDTDCIIKTAPYISEYQTMPTFRKKKYPRQIRGQGYRDLKCVSYTSTVPD